MGVPTVAESQLQRPSGSGVATATVDRTIPRPAKTAETPPHYTSPLYLVPLAYGTDVPSYQFMKASAIHALGPSRPDTRLQEVGPDTK